MTPIPTTSSHPNPTPNPQHQHRRTHNLLLLQKLLGSGRDAASPFTLVLDTLEQSGGSLVWEVVRRAEAAKIHVIFISFETLTPPPGVHVVIKGGRKTPEALRKEIGDACTPSKKTLIIIDTLYPLCTIPNPSFSLPAFLSSLITPTTSLLATYHLDMPLPQSSLYQPSALTLVQYLATTIFTIHSFPQTVAKARAAEKSLAEPVFGLAEEKDGVVLGTRANDPQWGVVVEMEHRRKSGRTVSERFYVPRSGSGASKTARNHLDVGTGGGGGGGGGGGKSSSSSSSSPTAPILLDDHPLYRRPVPAAESTSAQGLPENDDELVSTTFDLTLTRKQRDDRAGVVLPYFDAQRGEGGGGRILYDMGVEDDFDEEEDEI